MQMIYAEATFDVKQEARTQTSDFRDVFDWTDSSNAMQLSSHTSAFTSSLMLGSSSGEALYTARHIEALESKVCSNLFCVTLMEILAKD